MGSSKSICCIHSQRREDKTPESVGSFSDKICTPSKVMSKSRSNTIKECTPEYKILYSEGKRARRIMSDSLGLVDKIDEQVIKTSGEFSSKACTHREADRCSGVSNFIIKTSDLHTKDHLKISLMTSSDTSDMNSYQSSETNDRNLSAGDNQMKPLNITKQNEESSDGGFKIEVKTCKSAHGRKRVRFEDLCSPQKMKGKTCSGGFGDFLEENEVRCRITSPKKRPRRGMTTQEVNMKLYQASKSRINTTKKQTSELMKSESEFHKEDKLSMFNTTFKEYKNKHEIDKILSYKLLKRMLTKFANPLRGWKMVKTTDEITVSFCESGSLICSDMPVLQTRLLFPLKYSYDTIVELLASPEHIQQWDSSIELCEEVGKVSTIASLIHTVYKASFTVEAREFIDKRLVFRSKKSGTSYIFTSSVPDKFLETPLCKIKGTTTFRLCVIKKIDEGTSVTIYEQVHYDMEHLEKFHRMIAPTTADKLYTNLKSRLDWMLNQDRCQ